MSTGFKEIEEKTLKKLKNTELEILDEIDRICKKMILTFSLSAELCLGQLDIKALFLGMMT